MRNLTLEGKVFIFFKNYSDIYNLLIIKNCLPITNNNCPKMNGTNERKNTKDFIME